MHLGFDFLFSFAECWPKCYGKIESMQKLSAKALFFSVKFDIFCSSERQACFVKKETPFCFWNDLSWLENENDKKPKGAFLDQLIGEPNRAMAGSPSTTPTAKAKELLQLWFHFIF